MTETHSQPGPMRPNAVFVSWPTFKALGYIARASSGQRDALAEEILSAWIIQNNPEVNGFLLKRESDEKQFEKDLAVKLKLNPITG